MIEDQINRLTVEINLLAKKIARRAALVERAKDERDTLVLQHRIAHESRSKLRAIQRRNRYEGKLAAAKAAAS